MTTVGVVLRGSGGVPAGFWRISPGCARAECRQNEGVSIDAGDLGLTVAAVARRLGIAPATLRTWDRRYGLGPSQHAAGSHRRYSSADVARLDRMRLHVISGVAPGDAAREALSWSPGATDGDAVGMEGPQGSSPDAQVIPLPVHASAAGATDEKALSRGLLRAAMALDGDACGTIVSDSIDRCGVVWTWERLVVPVLVSIGLKWEQTGQGIDVEHVLSEAVQAELSMRAIRTAKSSPGCVLLACVEGELHALALWAVAAGLAERGVLVRMLGARTPGEALAQAMRRIGPCAVMLWSQSQETGDRAYLEHLPELRPEPLILLGGPGWPHPGDQLRPRVSGLSEAITLLSRAAGAGA